MAKLANNPIISEYETFLNEKLRGDLEKLNHQLDVLYQEIADYLELQLMLHKTEADLRMGLKSRVDLGCNFYVKAKTEPMRSVMVCVGLGLHVEMERDEAVKFIDKKINLLEDRVSRVKKDSAKVKAHIKLVLEILRELQFAERTKKE